MPVKHIFFCSWFFFKRRTFRRIMMSKCRNSSVHRRLCYSEYMDWNPNQTKRLNWHYIQSWKLNKTMQYFGLRCVNSASVVCEACFTTSILCELQVYYMTTNHTLMCCETTSSGITLITKSWMAPIVVAASANNLN